jgi:hypothetical protein
MSVVELIKKSHSDGISHVDALQCVVKLSAVASTASKLYAYIVEQDLTRRSREELMYLNKLAMALHGLGEEL